MTKPADIYACLYVREFPAQALLRFRSELRNKPCVVMDGEPPLQEVCSLTRKVRRIGVTHGMTQVEVDTFSEITVLQRSSKVTCTDCLRTFPVFEAINGINTVDCEFCSCVIRFEIIAT